MAMLLLDSNSHIGVMKSLEQTQALDA